MEDVYTLPSPQRPDPDLTASTPQFSSARSLVRLIQCPRCSFPLRSPLRLPCGNTICRACLPPVRVRKGVTYPATKERELGFECCWSQPGLGSCAGEHCLEDCGVDVLMTDLVGIFDEVLTQPVPGESLTNNVTLQQDPNEDEGSESSREVGELRRIYGLVKGGRLDYNASETMHREPNEEAQRMDLERLTEKIRNELSCDVCYSLILDPLTTPCGHTFCSRCIARVLNHSDLCPVCRRKLNILSNPHAEPVNKQIAGLIESLFPEQIAARREALVRDDSSLEGGTIPLFVCTLSFPGMPTFLHVYERRYRIMMLRVMASGTRRFGMVAYNRSNRPQGVMGRTPFTEYGTLLVVERLDSLPSGRCLVVARGISRFKVIKSELHEGYHVGRTERVSDISLTEEEILESREVSNAANRPPSPEDVPGQAPLESMSTQELFELGVDFVQKQRREGSSWLHPHALMAYGNEPTDPALFPWWLASVLPVPEEEKYALLSTTSVRERLKIAARWARALETKKWPARRSVPSILWLAAPLLAFGLIPLLLGTYSSGLTMPSAQVFTSVAPFAFSVSVSFGSADPLVLENRPLYEPTTYDEISISHTFVMGAILAIFTAHVIINLIQGFRSNRFRLMGREPWRQPEITAAGRPGNVEETQREPRRE